MIDLDLSGKRAVVTGASLGIGEAVVKELADMGAEVVFCARNQEAVDRLAAYAGDYAGAADMRDPHVSPAFGDPRADDAVRRKPHRRQASPGR